LKKSKILKSSETNSLNVLGGQVSFLCEASETNNKWSLMSVDLPLNAGPPPHHHPWDEAYYILEGQVRFILGEEETIISKGDFVYAPANTVHAFFGASEEVAKVLVFDAPSTAGGFFKDCHEHVKELPKDLDKIPAIAEKYNMNFLPPR